MLSPYFPHDRRQKHRESIDIEFGQDMGHDPKVYEANERFNDQQMLNDPLFRFYFHRFLNLYGHLSLLKPNLIQESVADNPWKLIVAVTLLNKTTGKVAIPVFRKLIEKWPTPWAMSQANTDELRDEIHSLGTQNIRAKRLIEMSLMYSRDPPCRHDARPSRPVSPIKHAPPMSLRHPRPRYSPTPISHLPGIGPYALDSYRIFCTAYDDPCCEEWKAVLPTDKELVLYLRWKWAFEERKEWSPLTGQVKIAEILYLESLVMELTEYHARRKYG